MANRNAFVERLTARLMHLGHAHARPMFGVYGLYLDGAMMGIVQADRLYLKVDEATRRDYEAADMGPFTYLGGNGPVAMSYWQVPEAVLADSRQLAAWASKAHAAAKRTRLEKQTARQ